MEHGQPVIVPDLTSVDLRETVAGMYSAPVASAPLAGHPARGSRHTVYRYPPGTEAAPHRYPCGHAVLVLSGRLRINDVELGVGGYAYFPGGEVVAHASVREPCLFLTVVDGPDAPQPVTASAASRAGGTAAAD
jgi:hypothetical protein